MLCPRNLRRDLHTSAHDISVDGTEIYEKMNAIRHIVNGFLIGLANIIPGMSGGTLALVLGIYERLIAALRNIGKPSTVKKLLRVFTLRKESVRQALAELQHRDIGFLALLGVGAVASVLLTSKLIVYVLSHHHDATYGFFSGLILASIWIPARMLSRFGSKELLVLLVAVALILSLSFTTGTAALAEAEVASDGSTSVPSLLELGIFLGGGALAISAMILPGISGSFLMLAFGLYFPMLAAIQHVLDGAAQTLTTGHLNPELLSNVLRLVCFVLGCLLGLVAFTRLLNYLLESYRNLTIAFLIGLMVGSLYGLWPFRDFEMVAGERMDTAHLLPQLDTNFLITLTMFLIGVGVILGFICLGMGKTNLRKNP